MNPSTSTIPEPVLSLETRDGGFVLSGAQFNQFHANRVRQSNDYRTSHTINNFFGGSGSPFDVLRSKVRTSAFHNSDQRFDAPKCYPGTRETVLDTVFDWAADISENEVGLWMAWLNGAAGAGKTAIAQSFAEMCVKRGIIVASFFFFRADPTRNSIKGLVATLAYQLWRDIPETRESIVNVVANNPLIFDHALDEQVEALVAHPLRIAGYGRECHDAEPQIKTPIVILIDGLDECLGRDVQASIIRIFSWTLSPRRNLRLKFLVVSRPEPCITVEFSKRDIGPGLKRIVLNSDFLPDNDIRLFLDDKFAEIKSTHPLKHHLVEAAWPSQSDIDDIVTKSSGQFIYASVVITYVSSPTAHPAQRLEVIKGLRPAKDTPFAQLDTLYMHIFSEVEDWSVTRVVLAFALWNVVNVQYVEMYLNLGRGSVELALTGLASIVSISHGTIKLLHASLPDFIRDKERSKDFHIDDLSWAPYLAELWFEAWRRGDRAYFFHLIDFLADTAEPSPRLQTDLWEFNFSGSWDPSWHSLAPDFLRMINDMTLNDGGKLYRKKCAQVRALYESPEHPLSAADRARVVKKLVSHRIFLDGQPVQPKKMKSILALVRGILPWKRA